MQSWSWTSRWASLCSSKCRRHVATVLTAASISSGCMSPDSSCCRSSTLSWLWVNWKTILEKDCYTMKPAWTLKPRSSFYSAHTSWICAAIAAFVSKSSVWIFSMYSSFLSHWKLKKTKQNKKYDKKSFKKITKHESGETGGHCSPGQHIPATAAEASSFHPDFVLEEDRVDHVGSPSHTCHERRGAAEALMLLSKNCFKILYSHFL